MNERLTVLNLMEGETSSGEDVIAGLQSEPKSLPPKYFYDPLGSKLFEQICELPEYYLTRTETAILRQYAGAIATQTGPCEIIELGSGSSTKTRLLLDAYQAAGHPLRYLPVDVSDTMLTESAEQLLSEYPSLSIYALASTYELALDKLPSQELPARMVIFIGSTLGNFYPDERDALLNHVSNVLAPGDYFLLGLDLHKATDVLEAAYNDSEGVTAAFNLNMLRHLNWRFRSDFDVEQFAHVACYNEAEKQIEMYLESLAEQTVRLEALDLTVEFGKCDRILSEISRKFDLQEIRQTLLNHQLKTIETFTDEKQWFGLLLCQRWNE